MKENRKQKELLLPFNLFLIGFMGSGKSTIARELQACYGMELAEMDEMIEKKEKKSISQIFETKGEAYFRGLETELLAEFQKRKNLVVSCGGGVPMREENVESMKKSGKIVLLLAEPETILERVKNSHDRPLLEHNKNKDYIAQLMEARREKYEKAADLTICTDKKSRQEICREILSRLQQ